MKIGILPYPYFEQKSVGGDEVLFHAIAGELSQCYQVEWLRYSPLYRVWIRKLPSGLRKLAVKVEELLLPVLIPRWVEKTGNEYSVVVADSATLWRRPDIQGEMVCVVNMDYQGYLENVSRHLTYYQRWVLRVKSLYQNQLIRSVPSVAVSHYLYCQLSPRLPYEMTYVPNRVTVLDDASIMAQPLGINEAMLFVGSGDYYGKGIDVLESLAKQGLLIDAVTSFPCRYVKQLPPRSRDELLMLMRQYRLFIFPSRYETFGFVVYEALSLGLPVLMGRVGIGEEIEALCAEFIIDDWDNDVHGRLRLLLENYEAYSERARMVAKQIEISFAKQPTWLDILGRLEKE